MGEKPVVGEPSEAGDFLKIRKAEVTFPDTGKRRTYESLERGDSVAAVVVNTDTDCVLLTRQFRFPTYGKVEDATIVEIPAGVLETGEEPEEAIRREILEELGYEPQAVRYLRTFFVSPGGSSERIMLFCAEVDAGMRRHEGGGRSDEDERIEIVAWEMDSLGGRIARGEVQDAKTLIGLQWLLADRASRPGTDEENRKLENRGRKCFVIMPFGERKDHAGREVDFDELYDYLIHPAVTELGITCERCDRIPGAGVIHERMFERILEADVAVVDTTTLNPNVFYELGIRHALCDAVTVLLRREGERSAFNIAPDSAISYDFTPRAIDEAKKDIQAFITAGLRRNKGDSPVFSVLRHSVHVPERPITRQEWYAYTVKGSAGRRIGLVTGSIEQVYGVDVWVNSENTGLEMARTCDASVSALIRGLGAEKLPSGRIAKDWIQDELREKAPDGIPPGAVLSTQPGKLDEFGVRYVIHAATVVGEPGNGFSPIRNLPACITASLREFDALADKNGSVPIRSILFPLFATGTARGDLRQAAGRVLETAITYLQDRADTKVRDVWFLAYTPRQLSVCRSVLDAKTEDLESSSGRRSPYS